MYDRLWIVVHLSGPGRLEPGRRGRQYERKEKATTTAKSKEENKGPLLRLGPLAEIHCSKTLSLRSSRGDFGALRFSNAEDADIYYDERV
jgi:hypothetical protein